jgi:hypothetical protein
MAGATTGSILLAIGPVVLYLAKSWMFLKHVVARGSMDFAGLPE